MSWKAFDVVFRLRSTLHIGWGRIGNLQRTRPYVTGRNLWGALTARLTRDYYSGSGEPVAQNYLTIGQQLQGTLAFSYFFVALETADNDYEVQVPWNQSGLFTNRFLRSYPSTALSYPEHSASEGTLHEVEFISPQTMEQPSKPVYLKGVILEHPDAPSDWDISLSRIQLGGERGYGWGRVELIQFEEQHPEQLNILGAEVTANVLADRPIVNLNRNYPLLAHTRASNTQIQGTLEPVIGREWRSLNSTQGYEGERVVYNDYCFLPGGLALLNSSFVIGEFGIWEAI